MRLLSIDALPVFHQEAQKERYRDRQERDK